MGKTDIKMIIESLYDLGVIQKRKKRKRRLSSVSKSKSQSQQSQQSQSQSQQSQSQQSQFQSPVFQNTSNLQNEYLHNQIIGLENSNNKPYIRQLETQLENQKIFQTQTQRALLYLHNNPIVEEVGYDDNDNIDVSGTGGSEFFLDEGVKEPIIYSQQSLNLFNPSKPSWKNFDDDDENDVPSPTNSEKIEQNKNYLEDNDNSTWWNILKTSISTASGIEPEESKAKPTRAGEREKLTREYFNLGGEDERILNTTRKQIITDAIKAQNKKLKVFEKLKSKYNVLGGTDEKLINANIKLFDELKNEVNKLEGQLAPRKSKK